MRRVDRLKAVFVDEIPDTLEDGILYVCEECYVALHNCACGCGEEVSTPLVRTEYTLTVHAGEASIWPSIGNHDFACKSHYVIRRGKIVWAGLMSRAEIEYGRAKDRALKRPPTPKPVEVPVIPPRADATKAGSIRAVINWLEDVLRNLFN
jgi:hypothetical protein